MSSSSSSSSSVRRRFSLGRMGPRLGEGDCDRALVFRTKDSRMLSSSSSFDVRLGGGPEEVSVIILEDDVVGVDGEGEADRRLGLDDGLLSDGETELDPETCGADDWAVGLVSSSSSS